MTLDTTTFFQETRKQTEKLCAPLETEDYVVQPEAHVSPPKWHLGHTTWFFEQFVLSGQGTDYVLFDENFAFVFNSYYESVGEKVVRTNRGNLSRPTVDEIYAYRKYVTQAMVQLLEKGVSEEVEKIIEIGIHHEKQHQELLLTDIKYILGNNPLQPIYHSDFIEDSPVQSSVKWLEIPEGVYKVGHGGKEFCYDNELGQHKVYLGEYAIANQLVTNADYIDFIGSGGYDDVLLWHADGWDWQHKNAVRHPLYWHKIDGKWHRYTLAGLKPVTRQAPVTHVSFYEAAAFAAWKGKRLPTEFEWEVAQDKFEWGQRWEWTESAYVPYPYFKKAEGALGEYNGKFMVNQKVLRGGSVATSQKHTRATYRNFFQPYFRWQFMGIRLAE